MDAATLAIVGRDEELALVGAFLEAPDELPRGLLLEGEAGIGKSTVWRHGVEHARGKSFRILETRPSESETALSFAGLGDLLADAAHGILPELPPPQKRALEVALLLRDPGGAPSEHVAAMGVRIRITCYMKLLLDGLEEDAALEMLARDGGQLSPLELDEARKGLRHHLANLRSEASAT